MALNIREFDTMVDAVLDRMINAPSSKYTNIIKRPESAVRIMIESIIHELDNMGYTLSFAYESIDFDNAVGYEIDRMVKIFGIYRDKAESVLSNIRFGRNNPATYDISIPIDTIISTPVSNTGEVTEFITTESAVLLTGQSFIDIPVKAVIPGLIFVPSGLVNVMPEPIIGIDYVTNMNAINGGLDEENDDELKERTKLARSGLGKATDSAIESAIKELSFVLDANVYEQIRGIATSDVFVVCDIMPPTQPMIDQINATIKSVKASGINVLARFPEVLLQNVEYTAVFGDDASHTDQRNAIGYATINYFKTLNIGDTLYKNQLIKYSLSSHDSLINITLVTPLSETVVPTGGQCIRIGTITINGEVWTIE